MLWAKSLRRINNFAFYFYVSGYDLLPHTPDFRCLQRLHLQTCRIRQNNLLRHGTEFEVLHFRTVKLKPQNVNQIINRRCYDTWQPKIPLCSIGIHSFHSRSTLNSSSEHEEVLIYELRKIRYQQLQFVSFFTYGLALYWLFLAPDVILGALDHDSLNWETASNLLGLLVATFILPSCVHYFRRQLVLKVYHNPSRDSFRIVMQRATLRQETKEFLLQDIKRMTSGHEYAVKTKFKVHNKSYFVYPAYFILPADYNHMMGFDAANK